MSTTPANNGAAASSNKPTSKNKPTFEHKFPKYLIYDSSQLGATLDKIYGADGWNLTIKNELVVITVNAETPHYLKEKLQVEGILNPNEGLDLWVSLVNGSFSKL